jgi:hypothetical protein
MDASLTPNARLALASAAAASKRMAPAGFLTGHIRGGRFIVEGVVAAEAASPADPDAFFALDALQPGRVIGFLLPSSAPAARKLLLRPHAVGKLVLAIRKRPAGRKPEFVGWWVDFDGRFRFKSAPIVVTFADQVPPKPKRTP